MPFNPNPLNPAGAMEAVKKRQPDEESLLRKILVGLFGSKESKIIIEKDKPIRTETTKTAPNIFERMAGLPELISERLRAMTERPDDEPPPVPTSIVPPRMETPEAQTISPDSKVDIPSAINFYGGKDAPLHEYSQQLSKATEDYEFFEDNPYLLPVIAHLETSSGKNITRPNNLLNWGINFPGNNEAFAKMTVEQVLDRAISGLGERSDIYERFRTGKPLTDEEIVDFANTYEPANLSYGPNLLDGIRSLEKELGGSSRVL